MAFAFENAPLTDVSLAGITIFEALSIEDRHAVARRCHGRRYRPGAQIVAHDDPSADVFFIVSGTVRVTYFSADGKEVSFRDQHAGQMFGEIAAIDGGGRSAYVVALGETLIASIARQAFLQTLADYPPVALATLRHMTFMVRRLTERVVEFSTLGVKNRIHAELLRLAIERPQDDGDRVDIVPAPKHADIASRVSTHREAVTRELNELARAGLLMRSDNTLTILDLGHLRRLVENVGRA